MSGGYAKRRDKNEAPIVDALVALGCSVTRLNGTGVPDLLVGRRGRTLLMEVKQAAGKKGGTSSSHLTEDQVTWWAEWQGARPALVRDVESALRELGVTITAPGLYTYCALCDGRDSECRFSDYHEVGTYPRAPASTKKQRKARSRS